MGIPGNLSSRGLAAAAAGIIAVTMSVTACRGSGTAAASTASCPAVPGITPKQLTYGLLYTASGLEGASFAPYRAGVDARIGAANANGGIYGRTINYTWADDAGQSQTNLSAAKQLVNDDQAFAVQEFTATPQGSAPWLNSTGIPVVGTSTNATWAEYRNMFTYSNLVTQKSGSVTTWGKYAKAQGVTQAVVLVSSASQGSVPVGAQVSTSLRSVGIKTTTIDADPNTLDVPTIAREIKNSGANLITGIVDPTEFIQIAVATRAAVPGIKILSLIGYDPGIFAVGRQLAGMSISVSYAPFERKMPAHRTFLNAMARYAPQQQPAANSVALTGWVDADLMLRGLQAAGRCPTRATFTTNLRAIPSYDAGGLLPSPVNLRTSFGQLATCYNIVQIGPDGHHFIPYGNKPVCGQRIP